MSDEEFTGERLHRGDDLFAVDLARHDAAYRFAAERVAGARILDWGSGSGYGAAALSDAGATVVAVDRIRPDAQNRRPAANFVRADLTRSPIAARQFEWALSFQVIEHLVDPTDYLNGMANALTETGTVVITTPNLLTSDGENPYHVHEYEAEELATCLRKHFRTVEMHGVGATPPAARFYAERRERIARIVRIDPLRLRHRLPQGLVEWLFARFAVLVRRGIQSGAGGLPQVTWSDFPIGPCDAECLDLLAICREPR